MVTTVNLRSLCPVIILYCQGRQPNNYSIIKFLKLFIAIQYVLGIDNVCPVQINPIVQV